MRKFDVYDHVVLKQDPTLHGTIQRTHSDSFDALEDELIISHAEIEPDALNEFVTQGIPPAGYVFVRFAEEAAGSSLVREHDLILLSRVFQVGDHVRRDESPMTGTVVDVCESYILDPVANRTDIQKFIPFLNFTPTQCSDHCPSGLPPHILHPYSHHLLYKIPSREVTRTEDVINGDYVMYKHWVGLADDVQYDIVIALENNSIVVIPQTEGLRIRVPDYGKPLVALPDSSGFHRPDDFGATQGWVNTVTVRDVFKGDLVIVDRRALRTGRWIRGAFDPQCSCQGLVIEVRTKEVIVDWTSNDMQPGRQGQSKLPHYGFSIYENMKRFTDPRTLRPKKDLLVYDRGKMPVGQMRNVTTSAAQAPGGTGMAQSAGVGCPVSSGQDLMAGDRVKFRDPTAAAVKYQGSAQTGHGKFNRIPCEDLGGWDLNDFKIVLVEQEATVLWQDGTVTTQCSILLSSFILFEIEMTPSDIVLKREGMRQRPVTQRNVANPVLKDFDEMTFFEQQYDLIPASVGIVQSVDPTERVARVRWYENPTIELRSAGQILGPNFRFGPIGDRIEDVSLYEIMSFAALQRQRRDMCVISSAHKSTTVPESSLPKPSSSQKTESSENAPRSTTTASGLMSPSRMVVSRMMQSLAKDASEPSAPVPKRVDWIGEIVALGLDGSMTVRMGGLQPCCDVLIDSDSILAIINDRDVVEQLHYDAMDLDVDPWEGYSDWSDEGLAWMDGSDWSEDEDAPISETVEYEGGERLDNDSGDDNWESDEGEALDVAEEALTRDEASTVAQDVHMTEGEDTRHEPTTSTKPERSLASLRTMLGSNPPPSFAVLECEPPHDQFGVSHTPKDPTSLKRILKEHRILESSLPNGEIYARTYENRLDLLRCLIVGPKDTPYENAPFLVDLHIPPGFPEEPPKAHFHSWTSGLGRINPNLYEDGKICLSLLGTWSGKHETEKWSEKATILQLLISLQGLVFVRKPFYNEAGFEGYENDQAYLRESEQYSEKAFVMARGFVKHALLRPPTGVKDILAWLYLPHTDTEPGNSLLEIVIQRSRQLLERSEQARQDQDDSLLDSAGRKDHQTQVFLKPLSRGASVMLRRFINELQAQLEQLFQREV